MTIGTAHVYLGPAEPQATLIADLTRLLGDPALEARCALVVSHHIDVNARERCLSVTWQGWADLLRRAAEHDLGIDT